MIVVHGIPVYWGIETDPVDRSFITRATLHEVLPPFRQSIRAFRIRVSPKHWLHLGTCTYDREMRRWKMDATVEDIRSWVRRASAEEASEGDGSADLEVGPSEREGSHRSAGSADDEERGTVSRSVAL